jgi:hypothetical protein
MTWSFLARFTPRQCTNWYNVTHTSHIAKWTQWLWLQRFKAILPPLNWIRLQSYSASLFLATRKNRLKAIFLFSSACRTKSERCIVRKLQRLYTDKPVANVTTVRRPPKWLPANSISSRKQAPLYTSAPVRGCNVYTLIGCARPSTRDEFHGSGTLM